MVLGIELFRGIAALMVLVCHYAPFVTGGETGWSFLWTGVDMFFVISGYVFAPMVFGRKVAVAPYLVRRFLRIYPLYIVAVLAYYFFSPDAAEKTMYLLRHLLFLHTTASMEEAFFFNPAFWSLPVEIEFYLVLPLLALLCSGSRRMAGLFAVALLFSLLVNLNRGPEVDAYRILGAHLTGILPEFLVGIFLYRLVLRGVPMKAALPVAAAGLGIVYFEYLTRYGGLGWDQITLINAYFNFMCALGYAMLMLPVLLVGNERYAEPVKRIALFCGAISYGVYLFHNLSPRILVSLGLEAGGFWFLVLSTAVTLVLALLGYRLIENPARLYGRNLSRRMLHGAEEKRISPSTV